MTKRRYKIVGVVEEPVLVRLVLQYAEPVTSIPNVELDVPQARMGNFMPIIDQVTRQMQAKLSRDSICISYEDQKKEQYSIGQFIMINIEK